MPLWPGGESPSFPGAKTIGGALTVGGQILAADGVAAAPAYSFANDASAGMWISSAGSGRKLSFSQGGTLMLDLNQSTGALFINIPSAAFFTINNDVRLGRSASGSLTIGGPSQGQSVGVKMLTELTTIAAAATTDTTIQIPANAIVVGVTTRVTTVIPTATTYDVGVAGATTRYATGASTAATTTTPGSIDGLRYYAGAVAVTVTPNLTPGDTTGRLRVTIHYLDLTPPTS